MKTAEVVWHCFVLLFMIAGITYMIGIHIAVNHEVRAEHPTRYFAFVATTVLCIGYFAFYSSYVWRRIDRNKQ